MSANPSSSTEQLLRGYTGRISIVLALGMLTTNLGRQILPPLLPHLVEDLSITSSQAGFALTVLWAAFALSQYPAGRSSDDLTRKTVLMIGLLLMAASYTALGIAHSYYGLLIGAGLAGAGTGLYIITSRAYLSDLFVKRRGLAFGFNQATGQLGGALASGLAILAVAVATWRTSFGAIVLCLLGASVLLHYYSRESYVLASVDLPVWSSFTRVFQSRDLRLFVVSYSLFNFAMQSIIGFLPTFLQVVRGFDPAIASANYALLFVIAVPVMPFAGRVGDRFSKTYVAAGSLLAMACGLVAILSTNSIPGTALSTSLFAVGMWSFPPVMQAYLMGVFPDENIAGDFGVFRTIYLAIGSLGPSYVGIVAQGATYTVAFAGATVCILCGLMLLLYQIRTRY